MLKITAYGRIASDIKVARSKDEKHLYTNFLLASHYYSNKETQTTFIRCTAFDATATLLGEYFAKGDRITLQGDLIEDDYKGSKFVFKIKVTNFEFVETLSEHKKNKDKHHNKKS